MGVATDIAASWTRPRPVVRRHLQNGLREDRALVFLMIGCAFAALSQLPRLVRQDSMSPEFDFGVQLGGLILGWLFIAPLVLYLMAAATHILAKLFRGRGTWYGARLALFWALLASGPVWLMSGLVNGYLGGGGPVSSIVSLVALLVFLHIWLVGLAEAEYGIRTE